MLVKLKNGLIATAICRAIERSLDKKFGLHPVLFIDDLDISESDTGVTHCIMKFEANIETREVPKLIGLLLK